MEQGKHPKRRKTAYGIVGIVLLAGIAAFVIWLSIIVFTMIFKKDAPDCVYIHDTETVSIREREAFKVHSDIVFTTAQQYLDSSTYYFDLAWKHKDTNRSLFYKYAIMHCEWVDKYFELTLAQYD